MRRLLSVTAFAGLFVFQSLSTTVAHAADGDGDMVADEVDVCPAVADPYQGDVDGDGVGDRCDDTPSSNLVFGTNGDDTLSGSGGSDALYGEGGDDHLSGGAGNDFLDGGPGSDELTGGAGCDVFAVEFSTFQDSITDFDPELDRLLFPAHDDDPTDDAPPPVTFGGDGSLTLTFEFGNSLTTTLEFSNLEPGVEFDIPTGPCAPPEPFVCAPLYDFPIVGVDNTFEHIEFPFDGKVVAGSGADQSLSGTDCSDVIVGDITLVFVSGEAPIDDTSCGGGVCSHDSIDGRDGNDAIIGDKLTLDGSDVGGNDTIYAGGGDDLVLGDAELLGGTARGGDDTIDGGAGDDLLSGDGLELLDGAMGGNDVLIGGDGHDTLYGDALGNIAGFAAGGDDILIGGAGHDALWGDAPDVAGAAGSDTFVFDVSSYIGSDNIYDAGVGGVVDTILMTGGGLTTFADLESRSIVTEVGGHIIALTYVETTHDTVLSFISFMGAATGSTNSWADINDLPFIDVVVVP